MQNKWTISAKRASVSGQERLTQALLVSKGSPVLSNRSCSTFFWNKVLHERIIEPD